MNSTRKLLVGLWSLLPLLASLGTAAAAQPSHRLLKEFASSSNLRAFAMNAAARPSEGGVYYARYVANICGRDFSAIVPAGNAAVAKEIATKRTVPGYQLQMMADLPQRCAAFVSGEASAMYRDLKSRSSTSGDPLVAAEQELISASRSGSAGVLRSAMERAMQLDDPLLWTQHRLYGLVAHADPEAKKVLGIYLGGKVYAPTDRYVHLEASTALDLGFCKPNLPCALDDELKFTCTAGGACAGDRYAKAKQYLLANGGTEENWKRILDLTAQIQTALANKNASFFVR